MEPCKILLVILSFLFHHGVSQSTVTVPPGLSQQTPPTSTIYEATPAFNTGFPCAGNVLVTQSALTFPTSLFTTTVTADAVLSTHYTCCSETLLRSDATPIPPTFTTYLATVTTTQSLVCGGCEIVAGNPRGVYPADPTYNTTVTSPTTTAYEYTCTSRTTTVDTATFSGACSSVSPQPTFPRDFQAACLKSLAGLSGCPYECALPIGTYPQFHCYDRDISHDFDWSSFPIKPGCAKCLPPCDDASAPQLMVRAEASYTQPSVQPSIYLSVQPSYQPYVVPDPKLVARAVPPSISPSIQPSVQPSVQPSIQPYGIPDLYLAARADPPAVQPSIRPSGTQPDPSKTTPTGPSCTTPTENPLEQPVYGYPAETAAFRTTCPKYASDITLDACPYLCALPPRDSAWAQRFTAVPDGYQYCATSGVQGLPGANSYVYDSGNGEKDNRPCVACPTALASAPTPTPSPVVVVSYGILRYSCGTELNRRADTCPFLCGVTEYDVIKGGLPGDIGSCTNDPFYDFGKGGYYKHNFQPGAGDLVTSCTKCVGDCSPF